MKPFPSPKSLIYLASPYSHPNHQMELIRYKLAARVAAALITEGHNIYSPICHSHPISLYGGLSGKWEQWEKLNTHMMYLCDELWVAAIDGWQFSTGIRAEIEFFRGLGRNVFLIGMSTHGGQMENFDIHESCLWWQASPLLDEDLPQLTTTGETQ